MREMKKKFNFAGFCLQINLNMCSWMWMFFFFSGFLQMSVWCTFSWLVFNIPYPDPDVNKNSKNFFHSLYITIFLFFISLFLSKNELLLSYLMLLLWEDRVNRYRVVCFSYIHMLILNPKLLYICKF